MSTAIQNIERQRGRRQERREIMRMIRVRLTLYKKDLVLRGLLDEIKERHAND